MHRALPRAPSSIRNKSTRCSSSARSSGLIRPQAAAPSPSCAPHLGATPRSQTQLSSGTPARRLIACLSSSPSTSPAPQTLSAEPAVAATANAQPKQQKQGKNPTSGGDSNSNNKNRNSNLSQMARELIAPGSIRLQLGDAVRAAMATAFPTVPVEEPLIAVCNNAKYGEYQCNNAMPLFAKLKAAGVAPKSPPETAKAIIAALPPNEVVGETSIAGAGFINIKISRPFLAKRVSDMLREGIAKFSPSLKGTRCVVDFSSPNVAKEMHVGHLRSTIIGDTICRTLEFCGADVVRLNHIGDWGTQFGMLIQHMSELRPDGLGAEGGRDEDVADLMQLYRAAKKRFDNEEDFKQRAREMVTQLQSGDPAVTRAWQRICEASRKEFQAIYDRLGVTLQERGESFYNPMLKPVVEELKEKGVATLSDGAMCVFVEGSEIPLIVQKSDGGFGYASTDMAAIKQRVTQENADWIVYVTDVGQSGHFDLVFKAAKMAGWLEGKDGKPAPKIDHVGFGLVLGEDGKKFKTRSGDVVRLVELLDEAKQRCRDSLSERRKEAGEEIDEKELEETASIMGYGAVKYADLKSHRLTNYKFSFDQMLDLKGNTAVYLLYAHARIAGIVRKADRDVEALIQSTDIKIDHTREVELALHIAKLPEAVEDMLKELAPNRLTDYLYELSERFNKFYVECKVIGGDNEDSRLVLAEATARAMRQCFTLLGIQPLYRI